MTQQPGSITCRSTAKFALNPTQKTVRITIHSESHQATGTHANPQVLTRLTVTVILHDTTTRLLPPSAKDCMRIRQPLNSLPPSKINPAENTTPIHHCKQRVRAKQLRQISRGEKASKAASLPGQKRQPNRQQTTLH